MSSSSTNRNEPSLASEWIDLLDVSAAQGQIDWPRVAAAQVAPGIDRRWRGVIEKVAEGESYKDPTRIANIAGARAVGLPWGAYVYLHPNGDIEKQIENALAAIGDTMPSFPLALDLEAADPSLAAAELVARVRRARDATLDRFGRAPTLYSFPDFYARRMMPAVSLATDLAELELWWASYGAGVAWYPTRAQLPHAPDPWRAAGKTALLWQYSGNVSGPAPNGWTGRVDGISGDVDRSVFTGSEDAFVYDFCGRPRPDQLEPDAPIVHSLPGGGEP